MRSWRSIETPPRRGHLPQWVVPPFCALDHRPELLGERLVAVRAADDAALAELGEAHPAGSADLLHRAGRLAALGGHELREQLLDRLVSGQGDPRLAGVVLTQVNLVLHPVLHGHLVHHGGFVAQVAFHVAFDRMRPTARKPDSRIGLP
jgi:hypothetical protein